MKPLNGGLIKWTRQSWSNGDTFICILMKNFYFRKNTAKKRVFKLLNRLSSCDWLIATFTVTYAKWKCTSSLRDVQKCHLCFFSLNDKWQGDTNSFFSLKCEVKCLNNYPPWLSSTWCVHQHSFCSFSFKPKSRRRAQDWSFFSDSVIFVVGFANIVISVELLL